jgi:hypothetical protein
LIREVAESEGVDMDKYGEVLKLHENHAHRKSVEQWKADPTVVSVTDAGLPPGWVKIIQKRKRGKRVFFRSPSEACIL